MLTRRLFVLSAAAPAIAPVIATPPARADTPDTLTIARAAPTTTLDPGFLRESASLVDNVFDTLVARDKNLALAPGLALRWKSVDALTWEFTLRPGVSFHNGEAFTAEAVTFSLERLLDPAARAPSIEALRTIAGVEATGPLTVRIHTREPDALLPTRMSCTPTQIVPPAYVRSVGAAAFARQPIGTGPYRVTDFMAGDHVTLEAFDGHWRGTPAIPRVIWRAIPEPTERIASLLAGSVQLVEGVPAELVASLSLSPNVTIQRLREGGLTLFLGLKSGSGPLADLRVRRALSLAIDRQKLVDDLLKGFATPTASPAGPFDFGARPLPLPAADPDQAKKLLAEAGFPSGFSIALQAPARYLASAEIGQAIVRDFAAIGVKAALEVPPWPVYARAVATGQQAPIYLLGWSAGPMLDAGAALSPILHFDRPYSTASFPDLDALLDTSRRTLDPKPRAAALAKVQDLAAQLAPTLPLYREDLLYAQAKTIAFTPRADGRIPVADIRFVA